MTLNCEFYSQGVVKVFREKPRCSSNIEKLRQLLLLKKLWGLKRDLLCYHKNLIEFTSPTTEKDDGPLPLKSTGLDFPSINWRWKSNSIDIVQNFKPNKPVCIQLHNGKWIPRLVSCFAGKLILVIEVESHLYARALYGTSYAICSSKFTAFVHSDF